MFKIGEFSKISRVPAKTLRYYDEIGLLTPAQVDQFTGYRQYSVTQLPRLNRILALKDLGLSLAQIRSLLDDEVSSDDIRGMLQTKQDELQQTMEDAQARLLRVESRLRQIEHEGKLSPLDVTVKSLESVRVLSYRGTIPNLQFVGEMYARTFGAIMPLGIQPLAPPCSIYHDAGYTPIDVDYEIAVPVGDDVHESVTINIDNERTLQVKQLAGEAQVACTFHKGEYSGFTDTYAQIARWMEENGYRVGGAPREIYLTMGDTSESLTEIQFPIVK